MMGRSQKFSKGQPLGFVPDYRHALDSVGEPEMFASPAHVDSADSCTPKRKSANSKKDTGGTFIAPLQVFPVSKMSRVEKRDLENRLRDELQRVQEFQERMFSKGSNWAAQSSGSAPARKGPVMQPSAKLNRVNSATQLSSVNPPKQASISAPVNNTHVLLMKQCEALLKRLIAHQFGYMFSAPVDVIKYNIPDYFDVIKVPMDLGTVKQRLESGAYQSPLGFASDVRLTFSNAMTYNPPSNEVHKMADVMRKFFEMRWKPIEKKVTVAEGSSKSEVKLPVAKISPKDERKGSEIVSVSKKRKLSPVVNEILTLKTTKPAMTNEQKLNLRRKIESYVGQMPDELFQFLRRHTDSPNEDEMEIDLHALSNEALYELKTMLEDYERGKLCQNQINDIQHEVEGQNESGLSNSSQHETRGNELVEEDIDIGGNDIPPSNFVPVLIEKDSTLKGSKCATSSSSSSDSESSSSDSDSSNSSELGSDKKASSPAIAIKESTKSDRLCTSLGQEERSMLGVHQVEQACLPKPDPSPEERQIEMETTPSERPLSPGKQYRAALLKGRFADTILRAKEKKLDQVVKKDPEKLRIEKEELERAKREEKVRLEAEAKAAEDARKRAEAEAAAKAAMEAKHQRELEREAARRALQQMEKTVEINENSLFLKDLAMLQAVPGESTDCCIDECMPAHSDQSLVGFNLGSNPLEKLGLYMKADDDEDEEGVPDNAAVNDVEEGEID